VEVASQEAFAIARLWIGYVSDGRRILPDLTVEESLEIARRTTGRNDGPWTAERV